MAIDFTITKKINKARCAVLTTPYGRIQTPAFIPVATQATVKGLSSDEMKELGAQLMICNTYHLMLRPGADLVKKMGGLHKMMDWNGALMTDSGGFQAFSLGQAFGKRIGKVANNSAKQENASDITKKQLAKITEQGVEFKSHIDGSRHLLTPELSVNIQNKLGADIMYVLDECTSPLADHDYTTKSIDLTLRWAKRSQQAHKNKKQSLFGIVQGGIHEDLRKKSAEDIAGLNFVGFGIGGSFGESQMPNIVGLVTDILPENKPRHLLGIGEINDIILAVEQGADLFDCVTPTRYGRHGVALTSIGKIDITHSKYFADKKALDQKCDCQICKKYTRAYLRHLIIAGEINGLRFITYHNIYFMLSLFGNMRRAINENKFDNFKKETLKIWHNKKKLK